MQQCKLTFLGQHELRAGQDQNRSENPRWALICCYNTKRNDPYKESRHPRYSPLDTWADERIVETGRRQLEALKRQ